MCVKKQVLVFVMYITKRANRHTLPSILTHTDTVVQAVVMSYLPRSRMRHNEVYSLSNAIIIVALLLITTPHSAVGIQCPAGAYRPKVEMECTGGCPCPSVSGLTSGEIRSQVGPTYDAMVDCYWYISSDVAVTVTFSEFGTFAAHSSVSLYMCTNPEGDWPNFSGLGGLEGSGSQRNFDLATAKFKSTTGNMRVRFYTGIQAGERGFVMQWSVEEFLSVSSPCTQCPTGKYKNATSNGVCTDCSQNHVPVPITDKQRQEFESKYKIWKRLRKT